MMKTKKILTAVALPLMLAACNQDADLESLAAQGDYSNIPTVDVSFTANTGTDTRMENKFGWEVGDKIGLVWLGEGESVTIDGKAYQNHPLFCTNPATAAFETKTMLYEGTYFAYLPYSEKTVSVDYIPFTTAGQTLSTDVNDYAKHLIYITPALTKLVAEAQEATDEEAGMGKNIQLNLDRLSNAVTLNLTFGNATGLTDLKVLGVSMDLQSNMSASKLVASFDHKRIAAIDKNWNQMSATDVASFFTGNEPQPGAISATSTTGLAVTDSELTTYLLTLPSKEATAGTDKLVITVTTNYGDVVINSDDVIGQTSNKAIVIKEGNVAKNIQNSGILNQFGQSGTIDVYVEMKDASFDGSTITSQTELTNALNAIAAVGVEDEVELSLARPNATTDAAFVLDGFTMPEELKAPIKLTKGNHVSGIEFKGDAVINKQLTLGTSTDATVKGNMTVNYLEDEEGTAVTTLDLGANTLTVAAGATLTNEGVIDDNNSGTLTTAVKTTTLAAGKYISNAEEAKCEVNTFTNSGEIQWIAGTLPTGADNVIYAEVTNFQDLLAADAAEVTTVRFMNEVEFGNSNASLTFDNIATIECRNKVKMNIYKNALSGGCKIDFSALEKIDIKSGASFNVVSDDKANEFKMNSETSEITVAKDAELSFEKIKVTGATNVKVTYSGKVTMTDVTGSFDKNKVEGSNGTWSEINN